MLHIVKKLPATLDAFSQLFIGVCQKHSALARYCSTGVNGSKNSPHKGLKSLD